MVRGRGLVGCALTLAGGVALAAGRGERIRAWELVVRDAHLRAEAAEAGVDTAMARAAEVEDFWEGWARTEGMLFLAKGVQQRRQAEAFGVEAEFHRLKLLFHAGKAKGRVATVAGKAVLNLCEQRARAAAGKAWACFGAARILEEKGWFRLALARAMADAGTAGELLLRLQWPAATELEFRKARRALRRADAACRLAGQQLAEAAPILKDDEAFLAIQEGYLEALAIELGEQKDLLASLYPRPASR